jgi:membrane protein YqaA with SNARE-associated domain
MLASFLQAARRQPNRLTTSFRHLGAFGLFFLAIMDSSPIPTFGGPDILMVILVVSRRNPWFEDAAVATVGSIIGALITFRLARRAGRAYLESKFGQSRVPRLLNIFERWGTGALVASAAIPFPFPTSVFFAAAGASNQYSTRRFVVVVALARAVRYSGVGIVADIYGRRLIRVLRHPTQYWGWLLVGAVIFAAILGAGALLNRQLEQSPDSVGPRHQPAA